MKLDEAAELLGVSLDPKPTKMEVLKAFRTMSVKLHPDKNGNTPEATKKFESLNTARSKVETWLATGEEAADSDEWSDRESLDDTDEEPDDDEGDVEVSGGGKRGAGGGAGAGGPGSRSGFPAGGIPGMPSAADMPPEFHAAAAAAGMTTEEYLFEFIRQQMSGGGMPGMPGMPGGGGFPWSPPPREQASSASSASNSGGKRVMVCGTSRQDLNARFGRTSGVPDPETGRILVVLEPLPGTDEEAPTQLKLKPENVVDAPPSAGQTASMAAAAPMLGHRVKVVGTSREDVNGSTGVAVRLFFLPKSKAKTTIGSCTVALLDGLLFAAACLPACLTALLPSLMVSNHVLLLFLRTPLYACSKPTFPFFLFFESFCSAPGTCRRGVTWSSSTPRGARSSCGPPTWS